MYVLFLLVFLQTPSPSVQPKRPVVKDRHAHESKTSVGHNEKNGSPPATPNVSATPAKPLPKSQATDEKQKSKDGPYSVKITSEPNATDAPLFLPYLIVTGAGVVINGLILFGILRQNKINKIVAEAAQKSAKAAQDTANILVKSERAIVVAELRPDTKPEGSSYSLKVINIGRAPAEIISFRIGYSLLSPDVRELRIDEIGSNPIVRDSGVVVGGGKMRTLESRIDIRSYTKDGWMEISQLKKNGIFHGSIHYLTAFGEEDAKAPFCYYVKSTTGALVRISRCSMGTWDIPVPHRER